MPNSSEQTILITVIKVKDEMNASFSEWRERMNQAIATFPGFVSLEMQPPPSGKANWTSIQRFRTFKDLDAWRQSEERKKLLEEVKPFLSEEEGIQDIESTVNEQSGCVTEVFVTQVAPDKTHAYRAWASKIQQVEAQFPGYQGVYIQAPQGQGENWITILRFDTPEHLDNWLNSEERKKILQESEPMVNALQSHRIVSPFAGWFSDVAGETGEVPPAWKQTMLVLLVLFPIVMLELKFLNPLLKGLNSSLATFIGNAISVTLVTWPMMPLVIRFLNWWLIPGDKNSRMKRTLGGTVVVSLLYLAEIAAFWFLI